jgi:diadenosine tetraphosphate (Ap4A) HIT family hydrolase
MVKVIGFELNTQLREDCHRIGRLALSHVLLHRNAALPWLILVPEVAEHVTELYQLDPTERRTLDDEVDVLSRYLKRTHGARKINVAAIGNLVPQLHVHVVGRHPGDPCWPGVVWGNLPPGPEWSQVEVDEIAGALMQLWPGS